MQLACMLIDCNLSHWHTLFASRCFTALEYFQHKCRLDVITILSSVKSTSSLQEPTMSDIKQVVQPSAALYQPGTDLTVRDVPYQRQRNGIGVCLTEHAQTHEVLMNPRGDCVWLPFGYEQLGYTKSVLSKTLSMMRAAKDAGNAVTSDGDNDDDSDDDEDEQEDDQKESPDGAAGATKKPAKGTPKSATKANAVTPTNKGGVRGKINRISERHYFKVVISEEVPRLQQLTGIPPELMTTRHQIAAWKLFCGFNKNYTSRNSELEKVVITYIKIRLGIIPREVTEVGAAIIAFQQYLLESVNSAVIAKNESGWWCLPLIYVLSEYMQYRKLPEIPLGDTRQLDAEADKQRKARCKAIGVVVSLQRKKSNKKRKKMIQAVVAASNETQKRYIDYAKAKHHLTLEPPEPVKAPANAEDPEAPPPPREELRHF